MEHVLENLRSLVGTEIGVSEWMEITQERVNAFADATDDHQFIHVDPEKAKRTPFGGTIAHGYLTLSLVVPLAGQVEIPVGEPKMAINYGLDRLRYPAPVPVGSRIRARVMVDGVSEVPGGLQVNRTVTIEIEGTEKPALVAETIVRLYY
jgi:acyl dehydratase